MPSGYSKPVTWNDIEYESIAEAARAEGITREAMRRRVNRGSKCDDDLNQNVGRPPCDCEWNGISYPSITEAAKANKITPQAMLYRLRQGYTSNDDLTYRQAGVETVWDGKSYPSKAACARAIGVSQPTLENWLMRGYQSWDDLGNISRGRLGLETQTRGKLR